MGTRISRAISGVETRQELGEKKEEQKGKEIVSGCWNSGKLLLEIK